MLRDAGRVNFSHTLSPDTAIGPVQVETPGDVTPAISPREADFSGPGPLTELAAAGPHRLEGGRHGPRQLLTVSMDSRLPLTWQPLQTPPKPDQGFFQTRKLCSNTPATFQLPLI